VAQKSLRFQAGEDLVKDRLLDRLFDRVHVSSSIPRADSQSLT
jgi:hypothetical protein